MCQGEFENFKTLLCSATVLAVPCLDYPFKHQVEASNVGSGLVLLQEDEDGLDRPVCNSRKFNIYQLNYTVIKREGLTLI